MNKVIVTEGLTKQYDSSCAVREVSLTVGKGEIYGFLGLNGAGKTTTIRMLLGMIRPSSGACYLNGKRVSSGSTELWNHVGFMVETPYSYPDLTVCENLEAIRKLRGCTEPGSVDRIIGKLQLTPHRDKKAKHLSLGNAQRLGIAKALLHQPDILILDEPINGLDPAGIVEIRDLLHDLAINQGVTIFISSHILGEMAKLATRIGIIHQGRLIREVDVHQLDLLRRKRLLLDARNRPLADSVLAAAGYSVARSEEGTLETFHDKAVRHPEKLSELLVHAGCPPTLLKVEEEDLESFFLRTIGMEGDGAQ